jgi:hypothetical protein
MDAEDACFFDCLPIAMRDSFLQQAFKLLDQRDQTRVVPLVCRLWHQLAPSSCSSLELEVETQAAAESLTAWLQQDSVTLESIDLNMGYPAHMLDEARKLVEVVCSRTSLQSLKMHQLYSATHSDISFSSLTNLTSLELHTCGRIQAIPDPVLMEARLNIYIGHEAFVALLRSIATSLLHLTTLKLDAPTTHIEPQQLLSFTALRGLRDLSLPHTQVTGEWIADLGQLPITSIMLDLRYRDMEQVCSWLQADRGRLSSLHLIGDCFLRPLPLSEVEQLMSQLCTSAPHLQSLTVVLMPELRHSTALQGLTQLTRLTLYDEWDMSDAFLLRLSALTGLCELEIGARQFTGSEASFECLASSLQQLRILHLKGPVQEVARQAFGPRVAEECRGRLLLKPGFPAGG